jgi:hypothetical protein
MIAGILSSVVVAVIALVLWILFTPVMIVVDSIEGQLEIARRATFIFRWGFKQPPELRMFGIKAPLLTSDQRRTKKPSAGRSKSINKSLGSWLFLLRGCLKSISIRKLIMNVDTGDVVLNAQMVPAMFFLSNDRITLSINFAGRVYMYTMIELRLNRLLWTWVLFLTKK